MAKSLVQTDLDNSSTIRRWKWTFVVTAVFAVPAVLLAFMPSGVHWTSVVPGLTVRDILLFLISSFVQVYTSDKGPSEIGTKETFFVPISVYFTPEIRDISKKDKIVAPCSEVPCVRAKYHRYVCTSW